MQRNNNPIIGTPEKLSPAQLELLKAVIQMPGLSAPDLRKEFVWHSTPSRTSLDHRVLVLEKRGILKLVTVTSTPTIYPTDIGKATLKSLRPVPLNPYCITCDKSGKRKVLAVEGKRFCQTHVELFVKLRKELSTPKYMRKRNYVCRASNCSSPRPKDEDFCYQCREKENE